MYARLPGMAYRCLNDDRWTLLEKTAYDLVLMDCEMPVMDGYQATRRLRLLPGVRARTPVAALTAHAIPALRDRAFAAGVDFYLTKPLSRAALADVLRTVSRRQSAARPLTSD